jgi:hypothetical protein
MIIPYDVFEVVLFRSQQQNIWLGLIHYIEIRPNGNIYNVGFDIEESQIIRSLGHKNDLVVEVVKVSDEKYNWALNKTLPFETIWCSREFAYANGQLWVCSNEASNGGYVGAKAAVSAFKIINQKDQREYFSKGYKTFELLHT